MKQEKKKSFQPGFRLQLLAALLGMVAICTALVWFGASYLLQDTYDKHISRELTQKAQTIVGILDEYEGKISSRDYFSLQINQEFLNEVNQTIESEQLDISQECVDIFDSTMRDITYAENLHPCFIHGGDSGLGFFRESTRDTNTSIQLHQQLFEEGTLTQILETKDGTRQMVVGRMSADGRYGVMVSSVLTRVEEAGVVLKLLLPPLALILAVVALILALIISGWLNRPILQLSDAARQMARGNYLIRVESKRHDELGTLALEFNHMAGEVQRSAQLQRDLLANVSHDLRTPLTLIKGYAETVRDLTGDNPEKRTNQLNIIVEETDRLSGLVNSVMDLSKLSNGVERPRPVSFDMAQLCCEVAERYEGVCQQNGWNLQVQADTPCQTMADPAMMERALHNLLGNASHHLGEDKTFILRCVPIPGGCRVEVEDHGPGIPGEELPYLFDKYYRSRSDAGKMGTGLGLTITKAILQGHGFHFGVNSTLGKGTTFWFDTLPNQK